MKTFRSPLEAKEQPFITWCRRGSAHPGRACFNNRELVVSEFPSDLLHTGPLCFSSLEFLVGLSHGTRQRALHHPHLTLPLCSHAYHVSLHLLHPFLSLCLRLALRLRTSLSPQAGVVASSYWDTFWSSASPFPTFSWFCFAWVKSELWWMKALSCLSLSTLPSHTHPCSHTPFLHTPCMFLLCGLSVSLKES